MHILTIAEPRQPSMICGSNRRDKETRNNCNDEDKHSLKLLVEETTGGGFETLREIKHAILFQQKEAYKINKSS